MAELNRAVVVFVGEVTAADAFKATLRVDKVWKGKLGTEVTIRTGAEKTASGGIAISTCDWDYERGQKLLVFAYGSSLAAMKAEKCTPTTTLEFANATISILDEIVRTRKTR